MHPSLDPPRQVRIGEAAAFAGTTPRTIRHYHAIGLLPEPARGADDRRRYGQDDVVRLLWVRRTARAGIPLEDIRAALAGDEADPAADSDGSVPRHDLGTRGFDADDGFGAVLDRLDEQLAVREALLRRQRASIARMRTHGHRIGLLDERVARRLERVPAGRLRPADLDTLLVTERMLGPIAAAVQSSRFVTLAARPDLRGEADRLDAAEEALDDTVAVDDPRVAATAAERRTFEEALEAAMEASGLAQEDEAVVETWVDDPDDPTDEAPARVFALLAAMPYDWSPARLRCAELAQEPTPEGPGSRSR